MYHRRGILTNFLALALAFTMPLCCCLVNTTTGAETTCCTEVVEVKSCCQQPSCCNEESSEQEKESSPCCDDCGCTIIGVTFTTEWTPPVDLFGIDAPTPFFINDCSSSTNQYVANAVHGPPKFEPYKLGFSSAPPIRGSLILQV